MRKVVSLMIAAAALCAGSVFAQETETQAAPVAPVAQAPAPNDALLNAIGENMDAIDRSTAEQAAEIAENRTPGGPSMAPNYTQGLLALAFVVALILVVYWAVRRWGKNVPMLAGSHLGKVLGRVYLDRGTALHFVQVGEKVLLVGANANSVSLLGEFSAATFNGGTAKDSGTPAMAVPFNPDSFLAELKSRSAQFAPSERGARAEEDEIASLRGDIQRLQRYLREENREHED